MNNILCRYDILAPENYAALPYISMQIPIQYLMYMLEDSQVNNKEFWVIAQDISKAYDFMHLLLLIHSYYNIIN